MKKFLSIEFVSKSKFETKSINEKKLKTRNDRINERINEKLNFELLINRKRKFFETFDTIECFRNEINLNRRFVSFEINFVNDESKNEFFLKMKLR